MIESHDAAAVDDHEGGNGACAEAFEIPRIERHLQTGNAGIKLAIYFLDERSLRSRRGVFVFGGVAEPPRGPYNHETLRAKFGCELFHNRNVFLAVRAPVGPEKEEQHFTAERSGWRGFRADPFCLLQRRHGAALEREEIQIFLKPVSKRGVTELMKCSLQELDGLGALVAGLQHFGLDFVSRA